MRSPCEIRPYLYNVPTFGLHSGLPPDPKTQRHNGPARYQPRTYPKRLVLHLLNPMAQRNNIPGPYQLSAYHHRRRRPPLNPIAQRHNRLSGYQLWTYFNRLGLPPLDPPPLDHLAKKYNGPAGYQPLTYLNRRAPLPLDPTAQRNNMPSSYQLSTGHEATIADRAYNAASSHDLAIGSVNHAPPMPGRAHNNTYSASSTTCETNAKQNDLRRDLTFGTSGSRTSTESMFDASKRRSDNARQIFWKRYVFAWSNSAERRSHNTEKRSDNSVQRWWKRHVSAIERSEGAEN
ncbi:hypothetical protein CONLIGDRAFT_677308 [Coniochaeta ligniaria NRRL 30616]|uniref:Uncharacterized protein n=1 Tax=Coniochaeta ligniaria NRRL 30616 TaxID=1408157 RepID=A0A1J7K090_9PEZI|nr:hypothetical protein CONLIGDRAFT_677308 [Coniochaeta ligniaria NRRL 30616]